MPDSINRIALLALLAFVCLAGALGYRAASGAILTAREDNPRRIFAEQRTLRGSILDRDGEVIVETTGEPGAYTRSTLHPDAAPITGYYSINYGTSGVEQAFDSTLRGTLGIDPLRADLEALMHIQPIGRDVQVTLDLDVQRVADALLAGRTGAIVVLSVPEGEVLALASHPTFDPNTLDENWDRLRADRASPLLNRATQGEYQPGTALQPLVDDINRLKLERNAIVAAHNYMTPDIYHLVADITGDSLALAQSLICMAMTRLKLGRSGWPLNQCNAV